MIKAIGWMFAALLLFMIGFVGNEINDLLVNGESRLLLLSWLSCAFGALFVPLFSDMVVRLTTKKKRIVRDVPYE